MEHCGLCGHLQRAKRNVYSMLLPLVLFEATTLTMGEVVEVPRQALLSRGAPFKQTIAPPERSLASLAVKVAALTKIKVVVSNKHFIQ